ncbi:helix-hairpin-helix domain-containing protein [Lactiplantibacillus fabifermentans]|uniref:Come operon protein 1 n=2 Tax=Lactiplantibacillus fabifermentans TaxID=483011 RepID=A0A0R2NTY6_9LACO|nr:ComEA family DNA-binding protein [Lactiplantibacillus fabifermentans]ETY73963.1 competence protein ComEA [Lactiplantibacillus fabifermentans T30PCM01]KRO27379.1 come operon protein 1 [Lactiplantibacillus fabifermentans DSM 21115]
MLLEIWEWCQKHQKLALLGSGGLVVLCGLLGLVWLLRPAAPQGSPTAAITASATSNTVAPAKSKSNQLVSKSGSQSPAVSATSGPQYVDVKGAVKQPGVYQVTGTMRVADVLKLAQGMQPQADQSQVNLAAKVTDQQVIYVPVKGEKAPPTVATSAASSTSTAATSAASGTSQASGKINLNTADVAALQHLSGVGQKKAEKIIAYRQQHGGFKTVADLKNVSGIGAKTLAKFQDQLTV